MCVRMAEICDNYDLLRNAWIQLWRWKLPKLRKWRHMSPGEVTPFICGSCGAEPDIPECADIAMAIDGATIRQVEDDVESATACMYECAAEPECNGFNYIPSSGVCILKRSDANKVIMQDRVSGPSSCSGNSNYSCTLPLFFEWWAINIFEIFLWIELQSTLAHHKIYPSLLKNNKLILFAGLKS